MINEFIMFMTESMNHMHWMLFQLFRTIRLPNKLMRMNSAGDPELLLLLITIIRWIVFGACACRYIYVHIWIFPLLFKPLLLPLLLLSWLLRLSVEFLLVLLLLKDIQMSIHVSINYNYHCYYSYLYELIEIILWNNFRLMNT